MDRRDLEEILAPIERELQRIADALEQKPTWFGFDFGADVTPEQREKWLSRDWPSRSETR